MQLTGIHHLTAVSSSIRENFRFYTDVLGMRLVKRSVNQDDVSAYHLFYADAVGTPGTDLTFFDWDAPRERRGSRSITRTHLRVKGEDSLRYWEARLTELGVAHGAVEARGGRLTLPFEDREGQRLAFVDDGGRGDAPTPWERSAVPAEHQVRGLGPILMSVQRLEPTAALLTKGLGMRQTRDYQHPESPKHTVHVFEMGPGGAAAGAHAELHVAVQPDLPAVQPGAGGVHHVAFRSPDEQYDEWAERLNTLGIPNSGKVDRYWFRSLYLREPGGVLFEIATDGPGFSVDEDPATLGEKVVLAPFLEPQRDRILAGLKPID
ncbi:ring-cleaving dioxygenase [Roseisolibacter sp. H3M3-2]|uniref:ring-cleaving dioxygenase n=1 Tax=Roseisolibacter sp. H3M3-2 TaxID=3031323 RepID=UPI0023DC9C77|nr:ring-cleaving dioxygenase [Roseisolibacter sp. H3M3-2]MDF1505478.1 ring-cleaving dioxygenase [Roseisolibacter sp. H3M3-2]